MAKLHAPPNEAETRRDSAARFLYDQEELERLFNGLVAQWRADTVFLSSVDKMATHPAYQRIIGLGRQALPLILRELQQQPDHWFWALHAISGEDPVQPGDNFGDYSHGYSLWASTGLHRDSVAPESLC